MNYINLKPKFSKIFGQLIKYGLVGIINTSITAIIMYLLMNGFGVDYTISNAIGYIAGFFNSFMLNKIWTFKSNKASTISQFIRFAVVFAICYILQLGLVVLFVEHFKISENISQLIGMIFYTLIGFFFNKIFTFKQ